MEKHENSCAQNEIAHISHKKKKKRVPQALLSSKQNAVLDKQSYFLHRKPGHD
jgi:hypothetical protein